MIKSKNFNGRIGLILLFAIGMMWSGECIAQMLYINAPQPFKGANGLMGYKNYSGSVLLEPQFEQAYEFEGKIGRVKKDGKWGFIDFEGKYIAKPQFDKVQKFREKYALVAIGNKWGAINLKGEISLPIQYPYLRTLPRFGGTLAKAKMTWKGLYALVNLVNGKQITPFIYREIFFGGTYLGIQCQDGQYGFMNKQGNIVVPCQFDDFKRFIGGDLLAVVKKNGEWFYIDSSGGRQKDYDDNTEDDIWLRSDEPSLPRGGIKALQAQIAQDMKYPEKAKSLGIEGTVFVQFVVNKDGSLSDVRVHKGLDQECNKEAVRLIKASAPWVAGKKRGKPVRTRRMHGVKFKIK